MSAEEELPEESRSAEEELPEEVIVWEEDEAAWKNRRVASMRREKSEIQSKIDLFKVRWWVALTFGAVGFGAGALFWSSPSSTERTAWELFIYGGGGALGLAVLYLYSAAILGGYYKKLMRQLNAELDLAGARESLDTKEADFVTKLIHINFKYVDRYYEQTQSQANKSFALSAFASLVGLAIIGFGITLMFLDKTQPAYVTTAAGVASEFIAAVFFYLYNRTITKMSDYHDKLVITQNVSLALKIADELVGQAKTEAHKQLIDRLSENVNLHLTQKSATG